MKTLILFSSRDGQTREIATLISSELKEQGIESDLVDLHRTEEIRWDSYSAVVIGASIRYGHFHSSLNAFVKAHFQTLNGIPSAFFSVNLVARKAGKCTPQTNNYTRKFLMQSPWRPDISAVFAGALRYPRYGWLDKMMIRLIMKMTSGETDTSKEVVYTDWQQVTSFAGDIARLPTERGVK